MDNDIKRPTAALINKEWYESAKSVLNEAQLASLCAHAVEYVLYGRDTLRRDNVIGMVFAMVKPALDSDVNKYIERCARNAANAKSQRQRVAASGSESQRVAANTTTTTTSTPTTTSTTTPSLSPEEVRDREIWLIFGIFWYTGSKAIKEEINAFWNYYESLGWKNNKGAPIVSKEACARQWHRQFETGTAPDGAMAWFNAVKGCPIPDYNIWQAYAGAERKDDHVLVRLRCKPKFLADLQTAVPTLEQCLRAAWRCPAVKFETAN